MMSDRILAVDILPQPDDTTCGPTCLQAVYNYYEDDIVLKQVINEVEQFETGGTQAVLLGIHALKRGYKATIYTYNLHVFDPSWFAKGVSLLGKLRLQLAARTDERIIFSTKSYIRFLEAGGKIKYKELSPRLIKSFLAKKKPILTGLSATYLYNSQREIGETNVYDDIVGEPGGHFVVVHGYDKLTRKALLADPFEPNPIGEKTQYYSVSMYRLINSILLGIVTYDANLLIIEPR
jgi:hypothetical protein